MVSHEILKKQETKISVLYHSYKKNGGIFCPAFGCKIEFTGLGWKHIIGATGQKKRTSSGKYRRLKLFPYVKHILEKSTTIQDIRKSESSIDYALEAMIEVEEDSLKEYRKIRVIIREDKIGIKRFYSVMDNKKKMKKKIRVPHASVVKRTRREG